MSIAQYSLRLTEAICWLLGVLLCGFFLTQMVQGEVKRSQDIERFELAWSGDTPDTSLWASERIAAWQESRVAGTADVVAVLKLPRLALEVPVYTCASDLNMDRGEGFKEGKTRQKEESN